MSGPASLWLFRRVEPVAVTDQSINAFISGRTHKTEMGRERQRAYIH